MTSPEFEALIQYRRQLRDKQADAGPDVLWGLTQDGVDYPTRRKWHLTVNTETPARALCGYTLVKLVPKYHRPAGERPCVTCSNRLSGQG